MAGIPRFAGAGHGADELFIRIAIAQHAIGAGRHLADGVVDRVGDVKVAVAIERDLAVWAGALADVVVERALGCGSAVSRVAATVRATEARRARTVADHRRDDAVATQSPHDLIRLVGDEDVAEAID